MTKIKDFFKKIFTKENMKKFYFSFVWIIFLVFILDIVSKWAVVKTFGAENANMGGYVTIIKNFFYIIFVTNEGASFSIGDGKRTLWIIVSAVLGGGLLAYYIFQRKKLSTWTKVGLTMMIGGAFGNLIDRAFYWEKTVGFNGVVDFLDFRFGGKDFPPFNLADSALVVGVAILIILCIVEIIQDCIRKTKEDEAKIAEAKKHQQNVDKIEKSPEIPEQNSEAEKTEKN